MLKRLQRVNRGVKWLSDLGNLPHAVLVVVYVETEQRSAARLRHQNWARRHSGLPSKEIDLSTLRGLVRIEENQYDLVPLQGIQGLCRNTKLTLRHPQKRAIQFLFSERIAAFLKPTLPKAAHTLPRSSHPMPP